MTSQLLNSGVDFAAVDNSHANRLGIRIFAVMAEHESRMTSLRVKAMQWLALGDVSDAEPRSGKTAVIDFEGRRALVIAAQHLDYAIKTWRDIPESSEPDDVKSRNTAESVGSCPRAWCMS